MFLISQNYHKSSSRASFDIISRPIDMTKTCPIQRHPQNCLKTIKLDLKLKKKLKSS